MFKSKITKEEVNKMPVVAFGGGNSRSRSFNGLRLFLLAAGGNSECNESSNQERLFHCWFPLSINEVQKPKYRSNQVGDPIWPECYHGGSA